MYMAITKCSSVAESFQLRKSHETQLETAGKCKLIFAGRLNFCCSNVPIGTHQNCAYSHRAINTDVLEECYQYCNVRVKFHFTLPRCFRGSIFESHDYSVYSQNSTKTKYFYLITRLCAENQESKGFRRERKITFIKDKFNCNISILAYF